MDFERKSVRRNAFAPKLPDKKRESKGDIDGLSLFRELFHTPEEVGRVLRTQGTTPAWVARLRASDIFSLGLSLVPNPLDESKHPNGVAQPGHVLIPEISVATASSSEVIELQQRLAALVTSENLLGPFDPPLRQTIGFAAR